MEAEFLPEGRFGNGRRIVGFAQAAAFEDVSGPVTGIAHVEKTVTQGGGGEIRGHEHPDIRQRATAGKGLFLVEDAPGPIAESLMTGPVGADTVRRLDLDGLAGGREQIVIREFGPGMVEAADTEADEVFGEGAENAGVGGD